jgi:hypothetical protein
MSFVRRVEDKTDLPELGISSEKVCSLIETLREYAGRELPTGSVSV